MHRSHCCLVLLFAVSACPASDAVRPPAYAGGFYPADAGALRTLLKSYSAMTPKFASVAPVALIGPHAGYVYSGRCAAVMYNTIKGGTYKRVIVIGPSHRGVFRGIALPDYGFFQTPLGRVTVDRKAVDVLKENQLFSMQPRYERAEHSVEVQVPFLQQALPHFELLPLVVGTIGGDEYKKAARALVPFFDDSTLVVVSSDFTHFGLRFGFAPFQKNILGRIQALDRGAIDRIMKRDRPGFLRYVQATGATICGRTPIALLLEMLKQRYETDPPEALFLSYTTSAAVTGAVSDRALRQNGSVSYAAFAFVKPGTWKDRRKGMPMDLLPSDTVIGKEAHRKFLALARSTLQKRLSGKPSRDLSSYVDFASLPDEGNYKAGAFVTLKKRGALRGCIGTIEPVEPLWEAIVGNAINAALNDWRFSSVKESELEEIDIEISVLTPPREVPKAEDFKVGTHGIIIEKDGRRAVFLPQVAPEQGWDRETTLSHLCQKATLPPDAWKEGTRFWVFEAQVFGEKEMGETP